MCWILWLRCEPTSYKNAYGWIDTGRGVVVDRRTNVHTDECSRRHVSLRQPEWIECAAAVSHRLTVAADIAHRRRRTIVAGTFCAAGLRQSSIVDASRRRSSASSTVANHFRPRGAAAAATSAQPAERRAQSSQ